jgi:hypothetical protein
MRSIVRKFGLGFVACAVMVAACAHNVPQHKASGPDAKITGAKPLALENNAATDIGIVTYPGGDRVDWKLIELPAGKRGRLDLQMSWKTPRPGLQLSFDVFDEFNAPVVLKAKATKRSRDASIEAARGKYFVRVYAKRRGDAGQYKLDVEFHEQIVDAPPGVLEMEIPEPPKLADVPAQICPVFNTQDPTCAKVCDPAAPAGWPGCPPGSGPGGTPPPKCPVFNTQDPTCKSVCDPAAPAGWPGCPKKPPPPPFPAQVKKVNVVGGVTEIIIASGSSQGMSLQAKVVLVDGNGRAVPGGTVTLTKINKESSIGTVSLIMGVVTANPNVLVTLPRPTTP